MNMEELEKNLERFKNGTLVLSVNHDCEEDFKKYLKLNNIKKYWVFEKEVASNYRTAILEHIPFNAPEMKKLNEVMKIGRLETLRKERNKIEEEMERILGN